MDPFKTVALAAFVTKSIDLGREIFSNMREVNIKFSELYRTKSLEAKGALQAEIKKLESLTGKPNPFADNLDYKYLKEKIYPPEEIAIVRLYEDCKSTSDELTAAVRQLKIPSLGRNLFSKETPSVFKRKWLDAIDKMMDGLWQQLQIDLLRILDDGNSKTNLLLVRLTEENTRMGLQLDHEIRRLKVEILSIIRRLQNSPLETPHDMIRQLAPMLSKLVELGPIVTAQTGILSSLYFPEMKERYDQITTAANTATFEWIFQGKSPDPSVPRVYFAEWLQSQKSEDSIYWISGLPGSGKSTLMKFLCYHDRTKELLKTWADKKSVFICGFYFWIAAGSEMQKSKMGLLRSLVFEILKENLALIPMACPTRWNVENGHSFNHDAWSVKELLDTFRDAITQGESNTKFCFFIDGLDEYEGEAEDIVDIIKGFPKSRNIKFCLASRKWPAFNRAFGEENPDHDSSRWLYLEQLTKNDIQTFVRNELRKESTFRQFQTQNSTECNKFINEVVRKAEGVFLWVDLVVKALRRELRKLEKKDVITLLGKCLSEMPPTLPQYFQAMLSNVKDSHQGDAAKIYQIKLRMSEQPYLVMFSFLDEYKTEFGTTMTIRPYNLAASRQMHERMRPRLNELCTDLLDITERPGTNPFFQYKIRFLHRTVRDYMADAEEARETLSSWLSRDTTRFDPDIYICQSLVALVKAAPRKPQYLTDTGEVSKIVKQISHFARTVERTLGDPQFKLMNELDKALTEFRNSQDKHVTLYSNSFWYTNATFIQWAEWENLKLYVSARRKDGPDLVKVHEPEPKTRMQTAAGNVPDYSHDRKGSSKAKDRRRSRAKPPE